MLITPLDSEINPFLDELEDDHIPTDLRGDVRRIVRQLEEYNSGDFPGLTEAIDNATGRDAAIIMLARTKIQGYGEGQFEINLTGVGKTTEDAPRVAWARLILYTLFDDPVSTSGSEETCEVGTLPEPCPPAPPAGFGAYGYYGCSLCGAYPCRCLTY